MDAVVWPGSLLAAVPAETVLYAVLLAAGPALILTAVLASNGSQEPMALESVHRGAEGHPARVYFKDGHVQDLAHELQF